MAIFSAVDFTYHSKAHLLSSNPTLFSSPRFILFEKGQGFLAARRDLDLERRASYGDGKTMVWIVKNNMLKHMCTYIGTGLSRIVWLSTCELHLNNCVVKLLTMESFS